MRNNIGSYNTSNLADSITREREEVDGFHLHLSGAINRIYRGRGLPALELIPI